MDALNPQWCDDITAEAYQHTWHDRLTLCEEAHKPWRDDYDQAHIGDGRRFDALRESLDGGSLSIAGRWITLARLADTATFDRRQADPETRAWMCRALDATGYADHPIWPGISTTLGEVTDSHAWQFTRWVLGTAIPLVFEGAGLTEDAEAIRRLTPSIADLRRPEYPSLPPLREPDDFAWYLEDIAWDLPDLREWPDVIGDINDSAAVDHLASLAQDSRARRAGHYSDLMRAAMARKSARLKVISASGVAGNIDPDGILITLDSGFRLLRGRPLWFAFWRAAGLTSSDRDWFYAHNQAGGLLLRTLTDATDLHGPAQTLQTAANLRRAFEAHVQGIT